MEKTIGQKLRELREGAHLSQAKLGKILGCAQNAVFKYESDINFPPKKILLGYADYFNFSLDWLFGRCSSMGGKLFSGVNVDKEAQIKEFTDNIFKEGSVGYERLKSIVDKMVLDQYLRMVKSSQDK